MQRCLILVNLLLLASRPAVARAVEKPPPMARRATPVRGADLTGRWILTMPTGVQGHAAFERDGRYDHVRLRAGALQLEGEYELKGGELSMVKPTDEKMTGLVWRVKNRNLLELVEHPVSSQFGSDYRGAVLVRRLDGDLPDRAARRLDLGRKTDGARDAITFVSDRTWDVSDVSNKPLGKAQRVGRTSTNPPPGTTFFDAGGEGWAADLSTLPEACWIWAPGVTGQTPSANLATFQFTKRLSLDAVPESATISVAADDYAEIFVNERLVGAIGSTDDGVRAHEAQSSLHVFDMKPCLIRGANTIRILVRNGSEAFSGVPEADYSRNPAGLVVGGKVTFARD